MNAIQALLLAWDLSYGVYFNGGLLLDVPYVNDPNHLWWYFIHLSFILELLNVALNALPVIPGIDGSHILQSFFRCCGISDVKLYPYAWGVNFLCTLVVIVYMIMMEVEFLTFLWVVLLWYVFGKKEYVHWLAIQAGGPRHANEPMLGVTLLNERRVRSDRVRNPSKHPGQARIVDGVLVRDTEPPPV